MESQKKSSVPCTLDSVLTNRLRMKDLALICAVDSCRHMHRAAEQIHISQPSATKNLQEIEHAFGMPLFERQPRGMMPTDLGREVVIYATQTLAALKHFAQDLTIKQGGGYGFLAVGTIMAAAPDLVALAVHRLKSRYPLIQVQLLGETSDQILPMLELGKLDLAVGRFNSPMQHNKFDFEELKQEELIFIARFGHPLSQRRGLCLRDLSDSPWVLLPLQNPARILLEKEFETHHIPTPTNIVECSSIFAILQLLQYGDSLALMPEPIVRDHLRSKLLCRLPLEMGGRLPAFGVLTRRDTALRLPAQAFIDALRSVVSDTQSKKIKSAEQDSAVALDRSGGR
jgi:DNA-binding transcriptional LysR family regulator